MRRLEVEQTEGGAGDAALRFGGGGGNAAAGAAPAGEPSHGSHSGGVGAPPGDNNGPLPGAG
jgi:hypothetical protein